jgi:hypothetical protein
MPNIGPIELLLVLLAPPIIIVIALVRFFGRARRLLRQRLAQLEGAKAAGLVTDEEYTAGRVPTLGVTAGRP